MPRFRCLLAAVLLLAAGAAHAQTTSFTGPGDVRPAKAWWGLRAYTTAAAAAANGRLVNVSNTATGETCDIVPLNLFNAPPPTAYPYVVQGYGGLGTVTNCTGTSNGVTASTFCGTATNQPVSGAVESNCAIVTWYDQTGNGFNVTQSSAAHRAVLSFACSTGGKSQPCAVFVGVPGISGAGDYYINTAANFTSPQPVSFSAVFQGSTSGTFGCVLRASDQSFHSLHLGYLNGTTLRLAIDAAPLDLSSNTGSLVAAVGTFNGASSLLATNSKSISTGMSNATPGLTADINFGGDCDGDDFTGFIMEAGVWVGSLPTNKMLINECAFWGCPLPSPSKVYGAQVSKRPKTGKPGPVADLIFQPPSGGPWIEKVDRNLNLVYSAGAANPANAPDNMAWGAPVAVGDFNGDGFADLVFQGSGQLRVWEMNGANQTVAGGDLPLTTPPAGWTLVGAGDFIGNGFPDLVFQTPNPAVAEVQYMTGTVNSGTAQLPPIPAGWSIVAVGDFDGDGGPDLVLRNGSQLQVWLTNYGSVTLQTGGSQALPPQPSGWRVAGAADVNGDGTADLLFQNTATGEVDAWLMSAGQPTITVHVVNPPAANYTLVGAGLGKVPTVGDTFQFLAQAMCPNTHELPGIAFDPSLGANTVGYGGSLGGNGPDVVNGDFGLCSDGSSPVLADPQDLLDWRNVAPATGAAWGCAVACAENSVIYQTTAAADGRHPYVTFGGYTRGGGVWDSVMVLEGSPPTLQNDWADNIAFFTDIASLPPKGSCDGVLGDCQQVQGFETVFPGQPSASNLAQYPQYFASDLECVANPTTWSNYATGWNGEPLNMWTRLPAVAENQLSSVPQCNPITRNITSITCANGTVTVQTQTPHGFNDNYQVIIASVTPAGFNGTFSPTTFVDATHFSYPQTCPTGSGSGGTVSLPSGFSTPNYVYAGWVSKQLKIQGGSMQSVDLDAMIQFSFEAPQVRNPSKGQPTPIEAAYYFKVLGYGRFEVWQNCSQVANGSGCGTCSAANISAGICNANPPNAVAFGNSCPRIQLNVTVYQNTTLYEGPGAANSMSNGADATGYDAGGGGDGSGWQLINCVDYANDIEPMSYFGPGFTDASGVSTFSMQSFTATYQMPGGALSTTSFPGFGPSAMGPLRVGVNNGVE